MDLNINVPLAMNNKTNKAFLLHSTIYWSVCSVRKLQQTFRKPEKKKEKTNKQKSNSIFCELILQVPVKDHLVSLRLNHEFIW